MLIWVLYSDTGAKLNFGKQPGSGDVYTALEYLE